MHRFAEGHKKRPTREEIEAADKHVKVARRTLRATSKKIDEAMLKLSKEGSEHWPEVLSSAPDISDFKRMNFLQTDNLSINSYEDMRPLGGKGRNDVFEAKLDGHVVVLKAYDLKKASEIDSVKNEVMRLHQLRHPNIIEVDAVFEDKNKAGSKMYLQMQRYPHDLKDWLDENSKPPLSIPPEQRRKILLGVVRGVARVHEMKYT